MTKEVKMGGAAESVVGTPVTGWMLFMAEAPIVGIDPHPAYAPNDENLPDAAQGWSETYAFFDTLAEAEAERDADFEAAREAVEEGDLIDTGEPDVVMPVSVDDTGRLRVFVASDQGLDEIATFSAEEVFESYGMSLPEKTDSPSP